MELVTTPYSRKYLYGLHKYPFPIVLGTCTVIDLISPLFSSVIVHSRRQRTCFGIELARCVTLLSLIDLDQGPHIKTSQMPETLAATVSYDFGFLESLKNHFEMVF